MHIVIVEKEDSVFRALKLMILVIIPEATVTQLSIWNTETSIILGEITPNFFFWAGEINGGNTTNQMLQVFREAFPQATHVAMSAGDLGLQMELGCIASMPKPFEFEALRKILKGH